MKNVLPELISQEIISGGTFFTGTYFGSQHPPLGFENYLHILSDFNQRKSLTKFRISNHKLTIETGRYSKPITPLENRICEKCFSDEIESEEHLLLKCSFYYTSRRKLLETIKNNINHSNFEKLSFVEHMAFKLRK